MWDVLKVYDVGGRLLNGMNVLYKDVEACQGKCQTSESFGTQGAVNQGCVMALCSIWMAL